jgi:hypothetical protein
VAAELISGGQNMAHGIKRTEVAHTLREVARKIERGEVELRSVTTLEQSREDRSPVSTVRVTFAPKGK